MESADLIAKLESILPDAATAQRHLSLFHQSVKYVRGRGAAPWAAHVKPDRIRLLVGQLIVMTVSAEWVWLATDDGADASVLSSLQSWEWDMTSDGRYKLIPSRNGFYRSETDAGGDWEHIRKAHFSFLKETIARGCRRW